MIGTGGGVGRGNRRIGAEVPRQVERQLYPGREFRKTLVDAELEVEGAVQMPQHNRRCDRRLTGVQRDDFALAGCRKPCGGPPDEARVPVILLERGAAPGFPAAGLEFQECLDRSRDGVGSPRDLKTDCAMFGETIALAASGQCEIVTLRAGETPVAAGIVLRHQDRAFFFKIGVDARFAKFSPGVQLTLELTRHLCADTAMASADSTASPDHPMINPIWRGRFAIGDVLIPLRSSDPVVSMIHAAIVARNTAREQARRAIRFIRQR